MGREATESHLLWDLSAFYVIFHSSRTAVKKRILRAPQRGGKKKKTMPMAKKEKTPRCVPMKTGRRSLNQASPADRP